MSVHRNLRCHCHSQNSDLQILSGKHPPARWQQSFSNASDPLVFPQTLLENDLKIHVLWEAQVVTMASAVAGAVAVVVASIMISGTSSGLKSRMTTPTKTKLYQTDEDKYIQSSRSHPIINIIWKSQVRFLGSSVINPGGPFGKEQQGRPFYVLVSS